MRATGGRLGVFAALFVALLANGAEAKKCPADSVQVGHVCIDKYEASVWEIPAADTALVKNVQKGKITSAAQLSGATQRGLSGDDYPPACPDTGNGCKTDYAVSIAGVQPSAFMTWFQAMAACRNSGKRLLTNAEWQAAALGTPDPGTDNGTSDCNITSTTFTLPEDPVNTGSRSLCVSDVGADDMVGNLWEWVADWGEVAGGCTNWDAAHGTDVTCFGGAETTYFPGGLYRGGSYTDGVSAGVFAASGTNYPSFSNHSVGFRCAREL